MNARRMLLMLVCLSLLAAAAFAQETDKKPQHPGVSAANETPRFTFAILTDRHGGR